MDTWAIAGFDCELLGCGWPKGLNRLFVVAERRLSRFQYTGNFRTDCAKPMTANSFRNSDAHVIPWRALLSGGFAGYINS